MRSTLKHLAQNPILALQICMFLSNILELRFFVIQDILLSAFPFYLKSSYILPCTLIIDPLNYLTRAPRPYQSPYLTIHPKIDGSHINLSSIAKISLMTAS